MRELPTQDTTGVASELGARRRRHAMPYGATPLPRGGTRFRLWAPNCELITLAWGDAASTELAEMRAAADGWHELVVEGASAGTRYQYVLPDGQRIPDPASRFQPDDVHGASEVIDPTAFQWNDANWVGRPWHEAVVYELHIGAFTREGTFLAAIDRLDHVVNLGATALEIMPIADFPGRRNWGYDGVLLYAPDASYGRPEELKAFIQAAHARGLMVILDVVYNHFGPEGNYLPLYAATFFTQRHTTPWGAALNVDGKQGMPVREFIIHNALYWLDEFNLDGLRLDAVHTILDDSRTHVLDELARRARALRPQVHLVLENENNSARYLERDRLGAPLGYSAQWNDDVHHGLHTAATGEDQGYYQDYSGDTEKLARALAEGFAFQGEWMPFRGSTRGERSSHLPPSAFVAFIQNHDQVGNRAFGERISTLAPAAAVRAIAAIYLLLPQVPMIFMGEEWGATGPFPFFCHFEGDLATAVRLGRRQEFAKFSAFQDEALREQIPDPNAQATFDSAKLSWSDLQDPTHRESLAFYQRLLAMRHDVLVPLLQNHPARGGTHTVLGPGMFTVRWQLAGNQQLDLSCNLSPEPRCGLNASAGTILWQERGLDDVGAAPPWFVRWSVDLAEMPR